MIDGESVRSAEDVWVLAKVAESAAWIDYAATVKTDAWLTYRWVNKDKENAWRRASLIERTAWADLQKESAKV